MKREVIIIIQGTYFALCDERTGTFLLQGTLNHRWRGRVVHFMQKHGLVPNEVTLNSFPWLKDHFE